MVLEPALPASYDEATQLLGPPSRCVGAGALNPNQARTWLHAHLEPRGLYFLPIKES